MANAQELAMFKTLSPLSRTSASRLPPTILLLLLTTPFTSMVTLAHQNKIRIFAGKIVSIAR
jgi:hypothetical protein